jgi:hypothetical protein
LSDSSSPERNIVSTFELIFPELGFVAISFLVDWNNFDPFDTVSFLQLTTYNSQQKQNNNYSIHERIKNLIRI